MPQAFNQASQNQINYKQNNQIKQTLSSNEVEKIWQQAQQELKDQVSPAAYNTWVLANPLTKLEILDNNQAVGYISTPTAFHATNLKKFLYAQLKAAIENALQKKLNRLEFKVCDPAKIVAQKKVMNSKKPQSVQQAWSQAFNSTTSPFSQPSDQLHPPTDQAQTKTQTQAEQLSPSVNELFSQHNIQSAIKDRAIMAAKRAGLRLDYKFNTFAVSSSNEMAHAAATAVSKRPGQAYNPLFLYGGVGVGKTHLMQAVGHNILENNPSSKIIYCTGEEFTNEIVNAIKNKDAIKFKKKFRNTSVLMIDDIQFIAGKNTIQEEFFHTFNALTKQSAQIILTSDRPPHEITLLEDRLRSRFEAGLMIDIQQPSLELRTAIVLIKSRANQLNIPINLAQTIAQKVDSARKIEGIITLIRSEVELKQAEIDQDLIDSILAREKGKFQQQIKLKPQKVIKKVGEYFQVPQTIIKGRKRNKEYVKPRHIAMHLLKSELNISYVQIGRWFSNRDHTSVMHAKNKIDEELLENDELKKDYQSIKSSLIKLS